MVSDPSPDDPPRPQIVVVGGGGSGPDGFLGVLLAIKARLQEQALEYCRDRSWEARLPVLLLFAYILFRHLTQLEYGNFLFNGINLGIHEAGHIVFRPFGEFLMIAGGTILQCLAPVVAAGLFYRQQRDFFAVAFCFGWLGTNCFNCAIYASDARGQLNLPLVSPWGQGFGADGMGDWSRMLRKLGMLEWDTTCLAFGGWLLWQMHRARSLPPPPPPSWA